MEHPSAKAPETANAFAEEEGGSGIVPVAPLSAPRLLRIVESGTDDEVTPAGDALEPENWYAWETARWALVGREMTCLKLGDALGLPRARRESVSYLWSDSQIERASLEGRLCAMALAGLIRVRRFPNGSGSHTTLYSLTDAGEASLKAPGPPKRQGEPWPRYCGRLAFSIADKYHVTTHAMLRGTAYVARARLCATLDAAGFSPEQSAMHFGIPTERVRVAIGHWARLRGLGLAR